jgi:hypothetical protein
VDARFGANSDTAFQSCEFTYIDRPFDLESLLSFVKVGLRTIDSLHSIASFLASASPTAGN